MAKLPSTKTKKDELVRRDHSARKARHKPPATDTETAIQLQQTAGNRAVTALLQPDQSPSEALPVQKKKAHSSGRNTISDAADAVVLGVARAGRVFRKGRAGGARAPGDVAKIQSELQAAQPLDAVVRGKMEATLGQDFSRVRIHNDEGAARVSEKLNARAFAVGQDIAFAAGEYQPGTSVGDALIAHELAHVVQQSEGKILSAPSTAAATYDALEKDAEKTAVEAAVATRQGIAKRDASSEAVPRMRSGLQLQRTDPAPAAPAPAAPAPDVSALPEGVIRDAVTELSQSTAEIERNTAQQLVEGNLHAYYIEDLRTPAGADAKLQSMGADPAVYTILLHPVTGEEIYAQKNFRGFAMGTDIFGMKSDPVAEWKVTLVHETSHAANPADRTSQLESYKTEFRAYWVADYANVADLDARAAQVKARVLQDYAAINDAYTNDPAVKTAIDSYTRPEGDVINVTGLKQPIPATP